MHEEIINQLKNLKEITPDSGFVSRTRNMFVPTTVPQRTVSVFNWQYVGMFAVAIIAVFAIPFLMPKPTIASLDTEVLVDEIQQLPINVQLQEIRYTNDVENTISDAISEVSNTETNHLNTTLLEEEKTSIETEETVDTNVDVLINQVIQ